MVTKNESKKSDNFLLEEGKYSALEIARLLLSYDPHRKYFKDGKMISRMDETNPTIGNFRLNKMLHICYMLYYSKYGKPLFRENLRAYPRGAIVYVVFKNFFSLFRQELEPHEISIKEEDKKFISKVYHYFRKRSDKELETFSHDDISWKETWEGKRGEIYSMEQDNDQMIVTEKVKNFYRDILGHIVKEVGLN